MSCFHHPEQQATAGCRLCGHPLCGACAVEVKGVAYCRDCLQSRVEAPPAPAAGFTSGGAAPREVRSPRVAGWLSVLPGLGLVYLGEYIKALVVGLIFVSAIHAADQFDPAGPLVALFWVGQIIFAVQEARRLNLRGGSVSPASMPDEASALPGKDSPVWGAILIGIGTLFLLDQFEMIRFGEIFEKFWPVLIIALGIQILLRTRRRGEGIAGS